MDEPIAIAGIDKAKILAALYNASQPLGMGFLHYDPKPMTEEEARAEIANNPSSDCYFDYLHGRVMKVTVGGDTLGVRGYDRDNGPGAARRALETAGLI